MAIIIMLKELCISGPGGGSMGGRGIKINTKQALRLVGEGGDRT